MNNINIDLLLAFVRENSAADAYWQKVEICESAQEAFVAASAETQNISAAAFLKAAREALWAEREVDICLKETDDIIARQQRAV